MFGCSEWMKFIRHLLKSPRTSGCIVIFEISSHTNDATVLSSAQEQGVLGRESSMVQSRDGIKAAQCVCCICVHSKRQLNSACSISKHLSGCREYQGGFIHPCTCRHTLHIKQKRMPQARLTINLTGQHGVKHAAGDKFKNNPCICLIRHVSLSMWVDSPL